jgi:hypothetical protein
MGKRKSGNTPQAPPPVEKNDRFKLTPEWLIAIATLIASLTGLAAFLVSLF